MLRLVLQNRLVNGTDPSTYEPIYVERWNDLDIKDVDIVLHKAFSDLEDPGSIESAYTLSVKLPFSKQNIDILGDLYELDYINTLLVGTYEFDQRKRYKFKLLNREQVLYEGDFVLNNVIISSNIKNNIFNVTLYDELYNVFKKLDYTIAEPADNGDIPNSTLIDKHINIGALNCLLTANEVANSWQCGCQYNDNITYDTSGNIAGVLPITNNFYRIGGFMPTYKKDDSFLYDTMGVLNASNNLVDPDTVHKLEWWSANIPKEMPEMSIDIYKTYNCKPYLYYKNYLEFLFAEIYRTTGYTVIRSENNYDYEFFKFNNPYYVNLIRTCKYIDVGNKDWNWVGTRITGNALPVPGTTCYLINEYKYFSEDFVNNTNYNNKILTRTNSPSGLSIPALLETNNRIYLNTNILDVNKTYRLKYSTQMNTLFRASANATSKEVRLNRYCNISIEFTTYYYSGNVIKKQNLTVYIYNSDDSKVNGDYLITGLKKTLKTGQYYSLEDDDSVTYNIHNNGTTWSVLNRTGDNALYDSIPSYSRLINFEETIDAQWCISNTIDRIEVVPRISLSSKYDYFEPNIYVDYMVLMFSNTNIGILERSVGNITYTNLLGEDFNILTGFTDYLKMFNLICKADYKNKKLYILQRGEFFNKYFDKNNTYDASKGWRDKIIDFTDNINFDEDIEITEIISDFDKIKYTYEDRDDYVNAYVRSRYDNNNHYMEYKTPYTANNDTYNYLEGLYNSCYTILEEFSIFSWNKWNAGDLDVYKTYKNKYPLYIDVDATGDGIDAVDSLLLFRNWSDLPMSMFTDSNLLNNRTPFICQLTDYEIDNDTVIHILPEWRTNPYYYSVIRPSTSIPDIGWYYHMPFSQSYAQWYDRPYMEMYSRVGECYSSEFTDNGVFYAYGSIDTAGIYNNYHKKWNDFIYANGNKLITANFNIPLETYLDFEFDRLITVNNNLYLMMSIDEYAFNNNKMKAKLLLLNNLTLLDNLDTTLKYPALLIVPQYFYLPASSNTYNTMDFKVYSNSDCSVYNNIYDASLINPYWIDGSIGIQKTGDNNYYNYVDVSAGVTDLRFRYKTNAQFPTMLSNTFNKVIKAHCTDSNISDYVYITNVPSQFTYKQDFTITPDTVYVPNDTNANTVSFTVHSTRNLSGSFSMQTVADNIITNVSLFIDSVSGTGGVSSGTHLGSVPNLLTIVGHITFNNTTGVPGRQLNLFIYDVNGASGYITFIRKEPEFHHLTEITTYNGNTQIWTWDYTNYEELSQMCTKSEFYFDLRTNYNFRIRSWCKTLYDLNTNESAFNDKCDCPELYDITNPNNIIKYDGSNDVIGNKNYVYKFKFVYTRRLYANIPPFNGFIIIDCTESHNNEEPFSYLQRVIANIANDNR